MVKKYMGILAKREMFFRFIGAIIFLLGFIISIILDIYLIKTLLSSIALVLIILFLFSFILCLKFELRFIRENYTISSISIVICLIILMTIGFIDSFLKSRDLVFLFISSSNILIIISWHYSLALYKKKKLISIMGYILYSTITTFLRVRKYYSQFGLILSFIPLTLITCGVLIILITEIRMKRKGLLNYL